MPPAPPYLERDADAPRAWIRVVCAVALGLLALGLAGFAYDLSEDYIARHRATTVVFEAHPFARQALAPNQDYRHGSARFRIGPHGQRGVAPSVPKRDGTTRVIAVGGSAVFDHLTSESWPERLPLELARLGRRGVEAFNFGVPGYSSRETLAHYHDRVHRYRPDVVVLYQGWNDVKYMRRFLESADVDRHYAYRGAFASQYAFLTEPRPYRNVLALQRMWQDSFRAPGLQENGGRLTSAATPVPATAWAGSAGLAFFTRNVRALVRQVKADGGVCVLVAQASLASADLPAAERTRIAYRYVGLSHDELVAVNAAMAEALRRIAREEGVPFVDPRSALDGRADLFSDHVHLRAEGSARLARIVAQGLAPVVDAASPGLSARLSSPR